ncbi:protein Shroom3 isoform X2 [Sardina pilchardus]|uniref:protein Shroom3 isoform X2 n=1 Tax=Sardina pilchardus TaxID=27697 RepID=UPI002E106BCF
MDNSFTGSNSTVFQRGKSLYVQARLQGGAPWGFTLKGGLEHGEALIISKVEEGGKADQLEHPLQAGDQVVIINDVELSGFRQEAISLVKGSYKTLWLTVRRECCPNACCSDACAQSCPSTHSTPRHSRACSGGVKLRIKNRRSEPASRPHSWHSTKLGDGLQDPSMMQISPGSMGAPWPPNYHSSSSTTDLAYEAGFLRKSPDQYSSRGSMESLDPPNPAYSSCHQLSASKSSNSIDHLHSKRDSAYSSFSTSSSIPEYLAAGPPSLGGRERSCSMEHVPQSRAGAEGMQQADIRYVRTVYDPQGVSEEHEVSSASLGRGNDGRSQARGGGGSHRPSSSSSSSSSGGSSASHRHSVGPVWGNHSRSSCESLKGAPAPPLRSDSFAAIRNHERPNSWSSLEQARSLRALHKGAWHHSSGSVAGAGKPGSSYVTEGQLHTVVEKSPESSPTTRPKQGGFPQASQQPGRPMFPTSIYQVPPPEPHFAQMPTSCPSSSTVYPALAKESRYAPQREPGMVVVLGGGGGGGGSHGGEGVAVENGYQSSAPHGSSSPPHPGHSQPKAPPQAPPPHSQHAERGLEELHAKYRSHLQPGGYRPPAPSIGQERRDPYTPVQPRGERPRYTQSPEPQSGHRPGGDEEHARRPEHGSLPEPVAPQGKVPQGQVAPSSRGGPGLPSRHYSESSVHSQDQEHLLTRLENALAEVQRCASPESGSGSGGSGSGQHPQLDRSMSVLERVSRFERREPGKARSQSSSHAPSSSSAPSHRPAAGPKSALSGVEDLRHGQDRSAVSYSNSQDYGMVRQEGQVDLHQRRASTDHQPPHRYLPDPALQRSKSTFHLGEENGSGLGWRDESVDIIGAVQDTPYNRAYRDSIKDAQSKVLRSTSFRRRDMNPPPVPVKHMSLERKGPRTSPKPSATSPHTPRERHVVTPDLSDRSSPPELPSLPPVGQVVTRIGGRKRLTMEQKKRSYSEPENMHEVGLSDTETRKQFLVPETSVADRRKMFEMAARRSQPAAPRPELRQMQQDAVAEYMKRKTGRRSEGGRPARPLSAYLQPASSSSTDSRSLSSTSSLASLQDPGLDGLSGGGGRQIYTLPANFHGVFYPGGRSHGEPQQASYGRPQSKTPEPQWLQERPVDGEWLASAPSLAQPSGPDAPRHLPLSQYRAGGFERAAPARSSGKSASAEDLLDRLENRPAPQHIRSRSSPSVEHFNQDFMAAELRSFGAMSMDLAPSSHTGSRSLVSGRPERPASASAGRRERYVVNPSSSQAAAPVVRRERQRHGERQRAQSAAGLAASVGLPSPYSPPSSSSSAGLEWSERLCPANLDAIMFPSTPHGGAPHPSRRASAGMTRQNSSDTSTSEETIKDFPSGGPGQRTQLAPKTPPPSPELPPKTSRGAPSPPQVKAPHSPDALSQRLTSLRISESALRFSPPPASSHDDDDVFLHEVPPPAPPSPPVAIRETDITEDFPPPPPPLSLSPPAGEEGLVGYLERQLPPGSPKPQLSAEDSAEDSAIGDGMARQRYSLSPPPLSPEPSLSPGLSAEGPAPSSAVLEEGDESLGLDPRLLSRRERSEAERRVEALARELVSRDKSLTPLLDSWAGRSSLDMMEEIFPAYGQRSSWQRRRSTVSQEDRSGEACNSQESSAAASRMETDLDEDEADLTQKQGELLHALALSVALLRGEKEQLAGEQKSCSALGGSMEALVQERCKPNERDKYRMFIGDLDKIVNLLLSLSGRLARVESALATLDREDETEDSAVERESLQQKRRQLCSQQEDAHELKENLDRRERVVLDFLSGYLSAEQLREHRRYVRLKPALLIRQRHLDELIRLGEEQLQRLAESLPALPDSTAAGPAPALVPTSPRSTAVTSL